VAVRPIAADVNQSHTAVYSSTYGESSQFAETGDSLDAEDDDGQEDDDDRPQSDDARRHRALRVFHQQPHGALVPVHWQRLRLIQAHSAS